MKNLIEIKAGKFTLTCKVINEELSEFNGFASLSLTETETVEVSIENGKTIEEVVYQNEQNWVKTPTISFRQDGKNWVMVQQFFNVRFSDDSYTYENLTYFDAKRLIEKRQNGFV